MSAVGQRDTGELSFPVGHLNDRATGRRYPEEMAIPTNRGGKENCGAIRRPLRGAGLEIPALSEVDGHGRELPGIVHVHDHQISFRPALGSEDKRQSRAVGRG